MDDETLFTVVRRPEDARVFPEGKYRAVTIGEALNFIHPEIEFRPRKVAGRWLLRVMQHGHAKGWVGYSKLAA
jgi:hypothetical protein